MVAGRWRTNHTKYTDHGRTRNSQLLVALKFEEHGAWIAEKKLESMANESREGGGGLLPKRVGYTGIFDRCHFCGCTDIIVHA